MALPITHQKTKTQIDQERYERELSKPSARTGQEQLSLFDAFVANTPAAYTNLFEFFDAVPKFIKTPQTSHRNKEALEIKRFEFQWGEQKYEVSIAPVVVDSVDAVTKEKVRKEVLPGPREETVYRVLKKMAADPHVEKRAKEQNVMIRFSLHQLRMRLKEVGHEFKVIEIREALEVLNRSPLNVTNLTRKRKLYSGGYIGLSYFTDETDLTGETSRVEISFNELAGAAVRAQLYDRIHYIRLMSLSPLAAWIYEALTRNFRQAGADCGYKLSLRRIMAESGMPARVDLRSNVRHIRKALDELVEKGVLSHFPSFREEVTHDLAKTSRGRKPIADVLWTIFPHEDVVKDIRADNSDQMRRRDLTLTDGRRGIAR